MAWQSTWNNTTETKPPPPPKEDELDLINQAKDDFKAAQDWEAQARLNFEYDYKFANGDTHNKYQWDNDLILARELDDKPCLTINKVQQHNLMVINDAKQNKPGVRIRPVGDEASFEGAQIYQELVYHIEYISSAENVYDSATAFQVNAGWGYWRIDTDYISDKTFDQEIYIRHIKDPRSVYLDPNINEIDGSDARYGIIFEDMDKDLFKKKHPKFANAVGSSVLGNKGDGWITEDKVRIALYYYKEEKEDKLVTWVNQSGIQVLKHVSDLDEMEKLQYQEIKKDKANQQLYQYKERSVVTNDIHWCKIAGDRIIEGPTLWLGKYIPIVRLVGTQTVIDGILDIKGHTRALINAQQIYNFMSPLALDTPLPTPFGWTTMGETKIGDWLFDENGQPVQIVGMSPIQFNKKCYRVEFNDGTHIVADADHKWTVEERGKSIAGGWQWLNKTVTTKELTSKKHFIYSPLALDTQEIKLPIDPYVLGVWLGDGTSSCNTLTSSMEDVLEMREFVKSSGYHAGTVRKTNTAATFTIHGLRNQLVNCKLLNNKHIPTEYLRASKKQRLALLQGLMDTDGGIHKKTKCCTLYNTNYEIVKGLMELLRSLNIIPVCKFNKGKSRQFPNGKTYQCDDFYVVTFSVEPSIPVFKLARKAIIQSEVRNLHARRTKRHGIRKIEEVNSVPVKCVTINSKSHLFLAGVGMVPTHNSSNVEYISTQSKTPWVAPSAAIEGFEEYFKTANRVNHSYLPYNAYDDDGNQLPAPVRNNAVTSGTGYVQQMQVAQNELMMASGQYQAQMGENENAKSGVAINARQRQGDRATYHFIDNQAIAIRFTGKILIDLIPKVYDTPRVKKILAQDGSRINVKIDTDAQKELENTTDPENPTMDNGQKVKEYIFNPDFGMYDIQADTGPSYATKRMETANILTQIATNDEKFLQIGGDILFKNLDFAGAEVLAQRYYKLIPPQISGDGLPPQVEEQMNKASDMIQMLQGKVGELEQQLKDKDKDLTIKAQNLDLNFKKEAATQAREDYRAETERATALSNTGEGNDEMAKIFKPIVEQLVRGMKENGELNFKDDEQQEQEAEGLPEGARRAPDGNYYIENPEGGYSRVDL